MKKLFRFQYEPCNGTCYAPEAEFFSELRNAPKNKLSIVIDKIVTAHDRMCNNPDMRFAVDHDENSGVYIGSWINRKTLDLFSSDSFIDCVDQLTSHILVEVSSSQQHKQNCNYSENQENLAEMILNSIAL